MQTVENNRFVAPVAWESDLFRINPIFKALTGHFPLQTLTTFPDLNQLNSWFAASNPQITIEFVSDNLLQQDGRYYEDFIFQTAQVPTRQLNWHDLFGALIWCMFPKSKAALNQRHMQEIAQFGQKHRSNIRHKLTLLDECGVVLLHNVAAHGAVADLRQQHWQHAFVQQRHFWCSGQQQGLAKLLPMIFGHAMYEMATRPFIGLTAKLWAIEVPDDFFQFTPHQQCTFVDQALSIQISHNILPDFQQQLTPLPLLGVPGWYAANQQASFYDNQDYFRPKRKSAI